MWIKWDDALGKYRKSSDQGQNWTDLTIKNEIRTTGITVGPYASITPLGTLELQTPAGAGYTTLLFFREGNANYGFKFKQDDAVTGNLQLHRTNNGVDASLIEFERGSGAVNLADRLRVYGGQSTATILGYSNEIYYGGTDADGQGLYINWRGYNDGFTRYRDFHVCNGKGSDILTLVGSDSTATFAGTVIAPVFSAKASNTGKCGIQRGSVGYSGYIEWHHPNGNRSAYMGWDNNYDINLVFEQGGAFKVSSGIYERGRGTPLGGRINYTPSYGSGSGSVNYFTGTCSYCLIGDIVHLEVEITIGANADTNYFSVSLPYTSLNGRNTTSNFRIWSGGAAGYGVAQVNSNSSNLLLYRGDGSNFAANATYSMWLQVNYFIA